MQTIKLDLIIRVVILTVSLFFLFGVYDADAQTPPLRREINTLNAEQLQAFRDAVAVMKSRDSLGLSSATRNSNNFRRSWAFWTNIHGHWGTGCHATTKPTSPLILGIADIRAWNQTFSAELDTWCTCAHSADDTRHGDVGEDGHFLTWHRQYTAAFERVLRDAARTAAIQQGRPNDPVYLNLTVPYWNYNANPRLPNALRNPQYFNTRTQSTTTNPLYSPHRHPNINNGTAAITSGTLAGTAAALQEDNYLQFVTAVEANPHGGVHCRISPGHSCNNGLMGLQETAGADTVFWLHHANIDRIYECWLRENGGTAALPTTSSFRNQQNRFISSTGGLLTWTVGNTLSSQSLNYTYGTTQANCPPVSAASSQINVQEAPASSASSLRTSSTTDSVRVKSEATVPKEISGTASYNLRLVLIGVTPDAEGRVIDVFVVAPNGKRVAVGSMSFFGNSHSDHNNASGSDFEFNVTGALAALNVKSGDKVNVVFETASDITVAGKNGSDSTVKTVTVNPEVKFISSKIIAEKKNVQ